MLNDQKKKSKKFKMSNFTINEFFGANLMYSFRGDVLLNFCPQWSHVNENETKLAKIQNFKFRRSLNNFGRDPS